MIATPLLAHDDPGTDGPLVVCLPGAGDVRSEYRRLAPLLDDARVVTADLPGHGESAPAASYGVAETAEALVELIRSIDAGPAIVVGCSFAPAAALWAAAEHPSSVRAVVALSPHVEEDESLKGKAFAAILGLAMRGPWAGTMWKKAYRSFYKTVVPEDLVTEIDKLAKMLGDPDRRRAVRQTLTASREGMAERIGRVDVPTLTVFGSADDHFDDPAAEAAKVAGALGGRSILVEGAGHYPHVERPDQVADAINRFISTLD